MISFPPEEFDQWKNDMVQRILYNEHKKRKLVALYGLSGEDPVVQSLLNYIYPDEDIVYYYEIPIMEG